MLSTWTLQASLGICHSVGNQLASNQPTTKEIDCRHATNTGLQTAFPRRFLPDNSQEARPGCHQVSWTIWIFSMWADTNNGYLTVHVHVQWNPALRPPRYYDHFFLSQPNAFVMQDYQISLFSNTILIRKFCCKRQQAMPRCHSFVSQQHIWDIELVISWP